MAEAKGTLKPPSAMPVAIFKLKGEDALPKNNPYAKPTTRAERLSFLPSLSAESSKCSLGAPVTPPVGYTATGAQCRARHGWVPMLESSGSRAVHSGRHTGVARPSDSPQVEMLSPEGLF